MTAPDLCQTLSGPGFKSAQIDRPFLRTSYGVPDQPQSRWEPTDRVVTPEECREAAFSLFERGDDRVRSLLTRRHEIELPWVIRDPTIREKVLAEIRQSSQRFRGESLARQLVGWLVAESPGGLGLRPRSPSCPEEHPADQAIRTGCADCTELALVAYEVFRLAGLDATFVEFTLDPDGKPFPSPHLGVGLRLKPDDPTQITPVDLVFGGFDAGHRHFFEISKGTMLAYTHLSRSERSPLLIRYEELKKAVLFAPENPQVRFAMGNLYRETYQWEAAVREYEEVLKLNPHFEAARMNLGIVRVRLGRE